jgi:hypothetical protein
MNLIKFKDNIRPGDAYFNTYLKDQYAYWVRMRYVIPMSVISIHDYVSLERDIDLLKTLDPIYWDLEDPGDMKAYIDEAETNKINDPKTYEHHNRYVCDPDITTDEVKKFRTWLAQQLLQNRTNDWKEERVFKYYVGGMMDDTVRWFAEINTNTNTFQQVTTSPCGCGQVSTQSTNNLKVCDPLLIYRESIRNQMMALFSDLYFWLGLPLPLLKEIKIYLDHITRLGLQLRKTDDRFIDCCDKNSNKINLEGVSKAFEYMILDEVNGNKNFIAGQLRTLANVYEWLYWA